MITILIDGAGTVTCQSVIKGLKAQKEFDVHIITMDMEKESVGAYWADSFYKVPPAKDDSFIPTVISIMKTENVDLLIPIIDYGFEKLSKEKEAIEEITGGKVVISPFDTIEICNDKLKFHNKLITFKDIKTCKCVVDHESYPYFAKPRFDGRASLGCFKINSYKDYKYVKEHVENPLFLEYLKGEEYTVDTLSDFEGNWVGGVTRVRTETKSGVSYKAKVVHDYEMLAQAKFIAENIGIVGPANMQCFKNDTCITWFEINPRFAGTFAASLGAGFNSPYLLLKLFKGFSISEEDITYEDVTMLRYWDELILNSVGEIKWTSQI